MSEKWEYIRNGKVIYDSMPVKERIALTAYLFYVISEHDGTYRRLIYDTLGLPVEGGTYSKLYPEGMNISNAMGDAHAIAAKPSSKHTIQNN